MLQLGDTFRLSDSLINNHLLIIISDPGINSDEIVMANFTTWRPDKDQSCIVEIGEHPFIVVKSCVHYGEDRLIALKHYKKLLNSSLILPNEPVGKALLKRILDGAAVSQFIPLGNRKILADQGLIDTD